LNSSLAARKLIQQAPGCHILAARVSSAEEPVSQLVVNSAKSNKTASGLARDIPEHDMTILKWALIFFLVSVVAGILGFTGISAASADVARFLFYVFVVIFLVLLILGLTIFRV
jgi:uncharacterized membrane protein YtjA (UPF0391 family)